MLYNNEVQFLGMLIVTSLCTIIELTAAYPADMNRGKQCFVLLTGPFTHEVGFIC